jgi:hypothetical protein
MPVRSGEGQPRSASGSAATGVTGRGERAKARSIDFDPIDFDFVVLPGQLRDPTALTVVVGLAPEWTRTLLSSLLWLQPELGSARAGGCSTAAQRGSMVTTRARGGVWGCGGGGLGCTGGLGGKGQALHPL